MTSVTSCTIWNDSIGKRISVTYSVIDEATGKIVKDNKRIDRIITTDDAKNAMEVLFEYAATFAGVDE